MALKDLTVFTPVGNRKKFFKMSFEGFAGDGKSYTMGKIALGLWEAEGGKSAIVLQDTEYSAKQLMPLWEAAGLKEGVNLFISQSRSLVDLQSLLKACADEPAILCIDSLTHLHEQMLREYLKSRKKIAAEMRDYAYLKPYWKENFSDPFVRAQTHILFTGRAAWEYNYQDAENVNTGKTYKEFVKAGVKMKGDNETAYEPDLLVLMQADQELDADRHITLVRRATVLKDRSTRVDGQVFTYSPQDQGNKPWRDFKPAYDFLCAGQAAGPRVTETPLSFDRPDNNYAERRRQQTILWEEIEGVKAQYLPGTTQREKNIWALSLEVVFNTTSETAIQDRLPVGLREGRDLLTHLIQWAVENQADAPKSAKEAKEWLRAEAQRWTEDMLLAAGDANDDLPDFTVTQPLPGQSSGAPNGK